MWFIYVSREKSKVFLSTSRTYVVNLILVFLEQENDKIFSWIFFWAPKRDTKTTKLEPFPAICIYMHILYMYIYVNIFKLINYNDAELSI